ncbi:hypothetical protein IW262DRAFT_1300749 [Armillaria fumosa]|nr:hypothetical protein IW262DRAFT_1300749 [Armillaria fumosa]
MTLSGSASTVKDQGNIHFKLDDSKKPRNCTESAAYYELGDYAQTYHAICRSAKDMLTGEPSPVLAISCGVQSGSITLKDLEDNLSTINELRVIAETSASASNSNASPEASSAGDEWKCAAKNFERAKNGAQDARSRPAALPFRQKNCKESVRTRQIFRSSPFVFSPWGGVGDGRHVRSSISGLHQAFTKINAKKRKALKVHFTLNDLHPRALARDLCLLFLIEDFILMRSQEKNKLREADIKATVLYTFKKFMKALLKRLQESPPNLPAWIYISQETIPGIIDTLKYWDTKIPQKNTKDILRHLARTARTPAEHSQFLDSPGVASKFLDTYHKWQEEKREQLKNVVDPRLSEEQVVGMASKTMLRPITRDPQRRKKWLADARGAAVLNLLLENKGDRPNATNLSRKRAYMTQYFVPPAVSRSRHDSFGPPSHRDELEAQCIILSRNRTDPSLEWDIPTAIEILFAWCPSLSLSTSERVSSRDCPAYSVISVFFDAAAVVDILITLKGRILLEPIQGDISAALVKMRIGLDVSRPPHFPRKYSTHGPMNTTVYIMPSLECESYAALTFNCTFNSGVEQNGDHYVHNYTLLSVEDYAHFFGCRVLAMDLAWSNMEFAPVPLPRPLSTLSSREELSTWLTRVLLATKFPPAFAHAASAPCALPSCLHHLLCAKLAIHHIDSPSTYLQTILSDSLVTDIAPRMNLDPLRVGFENILALSHEALPFPITLPSDSARCHDEIVIFEAPFNEFMVWLRGSCETGDVAINRGGHTDIIPGVGRSKPDADETVGLSFY